MKTIAGSKARFTYPNYGTPNSHPDHTAHSGQVVTVVRALGEKEVDKSLLGTVFEIRADDGWVGTANRDELRVRRAT